MPAAVLCIAPIEDGDIAAVVALWQACGLTRPWNDGHRGWVYYVAVDPDHRQKGFGRAVMNAAEDWLRARGIVKLQLMVRPDNSKVQAFYESIGYDEQERVIYAKWLDGREMTP